MTRFLLVFYTQNLPPWGAV